MPARDHREGRRVLIVGAGPAGRRLAANLRERRRSGVVFCGFLDERAPLGDGVRGRLQDLGAVAVAEFADEIMISADCEPALARRAVQEARNNRLGLRIVPDLYGLDPSLMAVGRLGELPVMSLRGDGRMRLRQALKRALDVLLSALALIVLVPMLAVIALVIRLDSRGPILYRASRVGRKGRSFVCYKFRTMVVDADVRKAELRRRNERQGPIFKIANDPRVTRAGRFLRRYSLDELPQLWNVLRGEMSLVGPRPHPLDDFERYSLEHLRRLQMKPGLTGLWQVTARRDPSFLRNMALDLEYIEHWDLRMDLRILRQTVGAVLQGSGV
jgi:exopolysaccharide biosynthesis polyprenyl glycosylphosphotransferase